MGAAVAPPPLVEEDDGSVGIWFTDKVAGTAASEGLGVEEGAAAGVEAEVVLVGIPLGSWGLEALGELLGLPSPLNPPSAKMD